MEDHYEIEKSFFDDFNNQFTKQKSKSKKYILFIKLLILSLFIEFVISIILFISFGYKYFKVAIVLIIGIEITSLIFSFTAIIFVCFLPTNKVMQILLWLLVVLEISVFIFLIIDEFKALKSDIALLIILIISCILKAFLSLLLAVCLRKYYICEITIVRIKLKLIEHKAIIENSGQLIRRSDSSLNKIELQKYSSNHFPNNRDSFEMEVNPIEKNKNII